MKLILTQPVDKLGKPGEVVTVADGYARNYLLPRKMAIVADKGRLKQVAQITAEHERRENRDRIDAQSLATRLAETPVTIAARVGAETTKLYGSVTASDIAEALKEQVGIDVDRRRIEMEEPIRNLGEFQVPVRIQAGVPAHVRVNVVALES